MKEYMVIYELAGENYSAYVPDLPGCVACGDTVDETEDLMRDAIELYVDALHDDGQPMPEPTIKARGMAIGTCSMTSRISPNNATSTLSTHTSDLAEALKRC